MRYDLIIVGGGLVGASLAVALQDAGLSIALIDARLPSKDDPRLFALNHYSCQLLQHLGVWPVLAAHAAPIHQVHVSHQGHFGAVRLNREEAHLSELGFVIPAHYIESALDERLTALKAVTLYRPAKLIKITQEKTEAELVVAVGDEEITITAPMVMAADGAESTVRSQLNIPTKVVDYQQRAIVTRTQLSRPHHQIAYERFNDDGAIAMLPLVGQECATIWTTQHEAAEKLMQLDDAGFLQELQREFGYRLGKLQAIKKRYSFPLKLTHAEKMSQGNVILLGNSAHAMHPIAAQGFNLALYEVAILVDKIKQNESLHDFDELISAHQKNSVKMSNSLATLFSKDIPFKDQALSLGMVGLNLLTPAKNKFINLMMGRSQRMPRLLMRPQDEKYLSATD